MASSLSSKIDLYNYTPRTLFQPYLVSGLTRKPQDLNSLSIVKDSFSGKYFGDYSYSVFKGAVDAAKSYYSGIVKEVNSRQGQLPSSLTQVIRQGAGDYGDVNKLSPYEDAKRTLSILDSHQVSEDNYVQKDQFIRSYDKYGSNWDTYFEGSYKNPRIDEANQSLTIPKKTSDLSIPTSKVKTPRLTGTGVSAPSATTNNPFGTLDAGLNI